MHRCVKAPQDFALIIVKETLWLFKIVSAASDWSDSSKPIQNLLYIQPAIRYTVCAPTSGLRPAP